MCPANRPYAKSLGGDNLCCPSTSLVLAYNLIPLPDTRFSDKFSEMNTCHKCVVTTDNNCDDYQSKFGFFISPNFILMIIIWFLRTFIQEKFEIKWNNNNPSTQNFYYYPNNFNNWNKLNNHNICEIKCEVIRSNCMDLDHFCLNLTFRFVMPKMLI